MTHANFQGSAAEARRYLAKAAQAAWRGLGYVEPNPLVGAVLVRDGEIIGIGHHRRFGGLHAEREALADCARRGLSARGATLYVTLEPCRHHAKQPPCTTALIEHGIARVLYARRDPHPHAGGGADVLHSAGIPCELSEDCPAAARLSEPFARRVTTGLPWIIAKWAQTIDGRTATRTGESQWISNELSRRRVHRLRARVDAIVTGLGTVVTDDPMLTARGVHGIRRRALRVLIDAELDVPMQAALVRTAREHPTLIACDRHLVDAPITAGKVRALRDAGVEILGVSAGDVPGKIELREVAAWLARERSATNVLLEAGPGLLGAFFRADLVDEALVYIAPQLIGDAQATEVARMGVLHRLSDSVRFDLCRVKTLLSDVELTYRRCRSLDHAHQ